MLPVLSASTRANNPRFEALYNDLCKNKLRLDGSSVPDATEQKQRLAFDTELATARLQAARKDVIITTLRELSSQPQSLPTELHDIVVIVAAQLDGQLTGEDAEIAHDATTSLKDHLPTILKALSKQLQQGAALLSQLTKQQQNSPAEEAIKQWKDTIADLRLSLIDINHQHVTIAQQMHNTYRQMIELCIRALEQTIHGAVSRSTKAKADYLVIVLEGMAKKLEVQYSQLITLLDTDSVRQALKTRNDSLSKQNRQLKSQLRDRRDTLDDHKRQLKGNSMATEYINVITETKALEREIATLQHE